MERVSVEHNIHTRTFLGAIVASLAAFFVFTGAAFAGTPDLATGAAHTCAIDDAGVLQCLGDNEFGQLGSLVHSGTTSPTPAPQIVALAGPAKAVAAGDSHTCVLLVGGDVFCFGLNDLGQLGNATNSGTTTPNPTPLAVSLGAPAVAIAAGGDQTCALLNDGTLRCFGDNFYGQLGVTDNTQTSTPNPTPLEPTLGGVATSISVGGDHACALIAGGTVECFGRNTDGQLGNATNNGTTLANATPTAVTLSDDATAVAAGGRHTCALLTGGTVECFGSNEFGQLGSLTSSGTATPVPTPTVTQALGGTAAALTTGNNHSCVLLSLGIVKCFGLNDRGQLGGSPDSAGTNDPNPTPVQTGSGAGVITIRAGGSHSCAILDDGLLRCVGDNSRGQIGSTFTGYTYIPFTVPTIDLIVPESPAVTPPTTTLPTTKPPVVTLARSKFKSVLRRGKLNVSGLVTAAGQGINATNCRGKIAINAKLKKKTLANRKFTLKFSGGKCAASVKFHFAKKYDGKKPTFRLSLSGSSTLTATASSFKSKL